MNIVNGLYERITDFENILEATKGKSYKEWYIQLWLKLAIELEQYKKQMKIQYRDIEEELKKVGFDVLVFIASEYEDLGRITCGNAILSGTLPECPYEEIK